MVKFYNKYYFITIGKNYKDYILERITNEKLQGFGISKDKTKLTKNS